MVGPKKILTSGKPVAQPRHEDLEVNEELLRSRVTCSVLITVATADLLKAVSANKQDELRRTGFPWEVWEGKIKVWESSESEYLQVGQLGIASGSARLPVGDLLQAVVDTRPGWSVTDLLQATRIRTEALDEALKAATVASAELSTAATNRLKAAANDAKVAATALVKASATASDAASKETIAVALEAAAAHAAAAKARKAADKARATADTARKAATTTAAIARESAAKSTAFAEAAAAAKARLTAITAAKKEAVTPSNAAVLQREPADAQALDEIYENFTVWARVSGTGEPELWVVLPIDMCMHGGC